MSRKILEIAKTETRKMFYSPVAWILLIAFAAQCGFGLFKILGHVEYMLANNRTTYFSDMLFNYQRYGIFTILYQYIYLYVPLLTMGSISEEVRNKTINLLYAAPLSNAQIVLGKFLSLLSYGVILMFVVVIFILFGTIAVQDFEIGVALSGLLGLFLMFVAYVAIGLFVSSLTSYPIVAAISSFIILGALSTVGSFWQEYDFFRDITWWLSINGRAGEFARGLICSEDILYFVILSATFISLTIIRLNAIRQKTRFSAILWRNAAVITAACLLGYLTSRPGLMFYHDASISNYNTLASGTQKILSDLRGKVTVNTYHNLLNMEGWESGAFFINEDKERFRPFTRFNPRFQFNNIYYYDTVITSYNQNVTMKQWEELLKANMESLRIKKAFSPQELKQEVDLSGEGKSFVRQLINEGNGRKAWLRVYDDIFKHPFEAEIAAALRRLISPPPIVGIVSNSGARSAHDKTDKGLYHLTIAPKTRSSLVNQGFDVSDIDLSNPIPEDIAILVIADLQEPLTAQAERHLQEYINRGGHLLMFGEPLRREIMNPIFNKFGFELIPGTLVKLDSIRLGHHLVSYATSEANGLNYWFGQAGTAIGTTGSAALRQQEELGYTVVPLFQTDSTGVWNEIETRYITEEHAIAYHPESGEKIDKYTTMVALYRTVDGQEQKIILSGDTDWLTNSENGIANTYNSIVRNAPFSWFTNENLPVDVRRPSRTDDTFVLNIGTAKIFAKTVLFGVPGILFVIFLFILFRRRGR